MMRTFGKHARRPLDDAARKRLFVLLAPLIVATVVAMAAVGSPGERPEAQSTEVTSGGGEPQNVIAPPAKPAPQPEPRPKPRPRPMLELDEADRRDLIEVGRRFLTAYLRHEVSRATAADRSELRATATPSFARALLTDPPRPAGTKRTVKGRIDGLELTDDPNSPTITVAAMIARGDTLSALALDFARHDGAWVVSALR